jgi:catechol 2,3-dioxygenase-like lactoylglutathione lyase family enzyme
VGLRVDHAVLAAADLEATVAFVAALGFDELARHPLDATTASALYGLPAATTEVVLGVEGVPTGRVRVVATPLAAPEPDPYHRGGHALDLYSTDIERSLREAAEAGASVGPLADYDFGPVHLRQGQATGPDHVPWVFVEIGHRLPSVLDSRPDRLHSELHSTVWSVDDLDAATAWWTDVVGLELRSRFPITEPAVSRFMGLPRVTPLAMSVLTGPGAGSPRFELLAFDGEPGPQVPVVPLVAGATLPVLLADDLDATLDRLVAGGARAGEVVVAPAPGGAQRAVVVEGPHGLGLELRSPV